MGDKFSQQNWLIPATQLNTNKTSHFLDFFESGLVVEMTKVGIITDSSEDDVIFSIVLLEGV
jgi:hypothetical protein